MDSSAHQQAYDRGQTIFSPDGRLYQVEYAREAVERGSPSVGVRTEEGVVLAARKRVRSPLLEPDSVEKVHAIDDHVAVASAGHAADARRLVDFAREAGQRHRLRYGEPIAVESLTKSIADFVQENTQTGGTRPFGAALLVAGVDDTGPTLFEVDPSGTPYGWRAAAIGDGADDIRRSFESRFDELPDEERLVESVDRGVEMGLDALDSTAEGSLSPADLDVCVVRSESVVVPESAGSDDRATEGDDSKTGSADAEAASVHYWSSDEIADALGTDE